MQKINSILSKLTLLLTDKLYLRELYDTVIAWREQHIKQKNFVIILALLVGICTSFAAILLKNTIHFIKTIVDDIPIGDINYLYLAFPAVGILLASLYVRFFVKDDISHGVTKILFALSQRKSRIKPHNMWSSMIASSLTIGFGGSVGAEAPIVLTGSAIGSNLGRFFKMDQKVLMLMIGCGAAGAIGGIFNAPIAGVVFTLEVLMLDLTLTSIVPLLISSVTATALSYFFMGSASIFLFPSFEPFVLSRIPYLILLGIICGFVSLYFTRGMNTMENFFRKITNPYSKLIIGGAILSVLIFLFPTLWGEGYATIEMLLGGDNQDLMNGSVFDRFSQISWILPVYIGLTILFKIVASSATNAAGGTGGIFAPSLFVGCLTGYLVAYLLLQLGIAIPMQNFAFAGMAGVMAGVMHAPLTGIFLIAELTGGYNLFMSLMIVATVSYLTIIIFEPHSLYAMRLAKKGELLTHHKDKAVLTLLDKNDIIDKDLTVVESEMMLGDLVKLIAVSNQSVYPVISKYGKYLGEVRLDEVRNIMFRQELYNRFRVGKLMVSPAAVIRPQDSMDKVMAVFDRTGAWHLPIVELDGSYVGDISKSKIFNSYREVLIQFSDD